MRGPERRTACRRRRSSPGGSMPSRSRFSRTTGVRSKRSSPARSDAQALGADRWPAASRRCIWPGWCGDVCRTVPPVRSMVRVFSRSSGPDVVGVGLGAGPQVGQPLPAAPEADDLAAHLRGPVDDALDDRVEAGHVAAAGQDADPCRCGHAGDDSPIAGLVADGRPRGLPARICTAPERAARPVSSMP